MVVCPYSKVKISSRILDVIIILQIQSSYWGGVKVRFKPLSNDKTKNLSLGGQINKKKIERINFYFYFFIIYTTTSMLSIIIKIVL